MADIEIGGTLHSIATGNVVARANEILDSAKNKKQSQINTETDATLAEHTSVINGMNSQNYASYAATDQTTYVTDVLPAQGVVDTVYRVGNWNGSQFDETSYSEYAWNGSTYVHISTKTQIGEVFDISAYHASGGVLAKYNDLAAALDSNNGGGIPANLRKDGMSIKFVRTSDNTYVQYRLMLSTFTASQFVNADNWQGVTEELAFNSKDLPTSDTVEKEFWVGEPDTVIDLSNYEELDYFINQNTNPHVWVNTQNYKCKLVLVTAGKRYVIRNEGSYSISYALLTTNAHEKGSIVYYATGYSTLIIVKPGDMNIILAPANATYLFISTFVTSNVLSPSVAVYNKHDIRVLDSVPIGGSKNPIESGGVFKELHETVDIDKESSLVEKVRTHNGSEVSQGNTFNRFHLICQVLAGTAINISCSLNAGVAVALYATRDMAINAWADAIQTFDNYSYQHNTTGECISSGWLNVNYKNATGGDMTESEVSAFLEDVLYNVTIIGESKFDKLGDEIDAINDAISAKPRIDDYSWGLSDAEIVLSDQSGYETQSLSNAYRIHLIYEIKKNTSIDISCSLNSGIASALYLTRYDAILGKTNYIEIYTNGYSHSAQAVSTSAGFLNISYKNSTGGILSQQDYDDFFDDVSVLLTWRELVKGGLIFRTQNLETQRYNNLYIGDVEQGQRTSTSIEDSTKHVSMSNTVGVPFDGCNILFTLPLHIRATIRYGETSQSIGSQQSLSDGDVFVFPNNYEYYSLSFYRNDGEDLDVEDVRTFLGTEEIKCSIINGDTTTAIGRNSYQEQFARAFMRRGELSGYGTYLSIAHISDLHGDYVRANNFFKILEELDVHYAIHTGDTVGWPYNGFSFLLDSAKEYSGKVINVNGNHDVFDSTDADAFAANIKPFTDALEIETSKSYYYYDDTTYKVRFIVLDVFENAIANGHNQPNITGTQMQWFIGALESVPADYGVILCYHVPADSIIQNNWGFYQNNAPGFHTLANYGVGITGTPIQKIINAFIRKEIISDNYTSHGDSYSYAGNFTSVPTTAEFICHLTGHEHFDRVGYYTEYDGTVENRERQLVFNICTGNALYGTAYPYLAHYSDCPRGGRGSVQDAFNVMTLYRNIRKIQVTRIGSFVTNDGSQRLTALLDY